MGRSFSTALSLDDVLLVPNFSDISSRSEIDLTTNVGDTYLDLPIVSAPMDTVTEWQLAVELSRLGGLGVIHRNMSITNQVEQVGFVRVDGRSIVAAAVGVKGDYIERAQALVKAGACMIVIDVAHGFHQLVFDALKMLKGSVDVPIMVGNICTGEAARLLADHGANCLRVGVGSGAACSTRLQAGAGYPQFSAILDCKEALEKSLYSDVAIVADGGIKNSGDIVKCLGAGADAVMIGKLFAGTDESPGMTVFTPNLDVTTTYSGEGQDVVFNLNNPVPTTFSSGYIRIGNVHKVYRGMASAAAKANIGSPVQNIEGFEISVPSTGPLENTIRELKEGIQSGLSYAGCRDIYEFHRLSKFVKVSPTASHLKKTV